MSADLPPSIENEPMDVLDRFHSIFLNPEVAYLTEYREFVGKKRLPYLLIEPTIEFR